MKDFQILDGGMGRELKRIGAPFTQPLWSAEALIKEPEYVAKAHQNFIDAGAQIITASSYACVPYHLGEEVYQNDGPALAKKASEIARAVADKNKSITVAGSLPPPFGSYRPDLFKKEEAATIAQALYQAQDDAVDLWIVETLSSIDEFLVARKVLENAQKPVYYSFSLDDENEQLCLRSGEDLQEVFNIIADSPIDGLLFNCSVPEVITRAISEVSKQGTAINMLYGGYANNFIPIKKNHQANGDLQGMRELTAEDYLSFAKQWVALGAGIVGGCCGVFPEHIKAIHDWKVSR